MKRTILLAVLIVMTATPASAVVRVVATLPWIGSVAKEIGRDKVDLKVLVKPSQDPHALEAKPSMVLAVHKADILMYNGLDLEIGYLPVLIESSRNPKVQPGRMGNFDCSSFVSVLDKPSTVDRSMGDVHPLGNPHYHFSPSRVLKVAEGMSEALSETDPANEAFYKSGYAAFKDRLARKQREWNCRPLSGKRFVAYHRLFEYLASEYGFQVIGYIEPKPGIPPSAGHVEQLMETMKRTIPDGILLTPYTGQRKEAGYLSRKTRVKVMVLPNDVGSVNPGQDYISFMDEAVSCLR